jgi:hypothetical protein
MYPHFKSRRIRVLFLDDFVGWWDWDDIANAMEIPAETLLETLTERQISEHVRVENIASAVKLNLLTLKSFGLEGESQDLNETRFMDDWCLNYFLDIYKDRPIVAEFALWLQKTIYDSRRVSNFLDLLHKSLDTCVSLVHPMKHLAFAMENNILKNQLNCLKTEVDIIRSILDFVYAKCEKEETA